MKRDSGQPEPNRKHPDLWELPKVLDVQIKLRHYERPRVHTVGLELVEAKSALEFTVETDNPFPIRAIGPALIVGRHEISEAEEMDERHYRFFVYEPDLLRSAAIWIGWAGYDKPRSRTGFRFEPDEIESETVA